jgi:hypothetical protein
VITVLSAVLLCRGLVRQLSIDQLDNEGRRVSIYDKGTPEGKTPLFQRTVSMPGVHKRVINELLRPRQWKPNHEDRRFMLQAEEIVELCDNAEKLFKQEKSVLELRVRSLQHVTAQQRSQQPQQQGAVVKQ